MSALSDKIASVGASVDSAIARVQGDIDKLTKEVADLQAKVDAGSASAADLAALDTLKAKVDALDPTKPVTLPPPVETPPADTGNPTGNPPA